MIDFTYMVQPPAKFTFEQPKLKRWVEKWSQGKCLNLFAGKIKLRLDEYRVDLNPDMKADWYGDAFDFVHTTKMKFDTIICDPPYNLRKSREKYGGKYVGSLTKIKNEFQTILNPNGRVIHLGYDSVGIQRRKGFEKIAICLVCHGGDHNDTICLVQRMIQDRIC